MTRQELIALGYPVPSQGGKRKSKSLNFKNTESTMIQNDLLMAAAGYSTRKGKRRVPRVKIGINDPKTVRDMNLQKLLATLNSVGGNKSKAAKLLKINRRTIYRWLADAGLMPQL